MYTVHVHIASSWCKDVVCGRLYENLRMLVLTISVPVFINNHKVINIHVHCLLKSHTLPGYLDYMYHVTNILQIHVRLNYCQLTFD